MNWALVWVLQLQPDIRQRQTPTAADKYDISTYISQNKTKQKEPDRIKLLLFY